MISGLNSKLTAKLMLAFSPSVAEIIAQMAVIRRGSPAEIAICMGVFTNRTLYSPLKLWYDSPVVQERVRSGHSVVPIYEDKFGRFRVKNKHSKVIGGVVVMIGLFFGVLVISGLAATAASQELEPNDSPEQANSLDVSQPIQGAIDPVNDVDYYKQAGVNTLWGYIALLDTTVSMAGDNGVLTAYASDGMTVLQEDNGSWEDGSVIAWQRFVNGNQTAYLKVSDEGGDEVISPYSLQRYKVAISDMEELEPNDAPNNGTVTAVSMNGHLSNNDDVDCFRFDGFSEYPYLFALNADPDNNGSSTDFRLRVLDLEGIEVEIANVGGPGKNEVIDDLGFAERGVYAFCVDAPGGEVDPNDEYIVGVLKNSYNYFPTYILDPVWVDAPADGISLQGSTLTFQLNFTNTSLLPIPGKVEMYGKFDDECLELVSAPGAVYTYPYQAGWEYFDLGPGENFSATLVTRAIAGCTDYLHESVVLNYYVLGTGEDVNYASLYAAYLPLTLRTLP